MRPATPLTTFSAAVTGQMNSLGRGGVVVAMSGGLVATMGLPAQALSQNAAGPEAAAPAAAPAGAPVGAAFQTALLTTQPAFDASAAPLTAPTAAKVSFETGTFTAVPKKAAPRPAAAAAPSRSTTSRSEAKSYNFAGTVKGGSILSIAARYAGVSYRYGGTTPGGGWDCSGATGYIFRQAGKKLPRTAHQQMLASTRISKSQARAGDLVFFLSGGHAYHVGIVAGNGYMWDAGSSGHVFSKRKIYSASVVYGRY